MVLLEMSHPHHTHPLSKRQAITWHKQLMNNSQHDTVIPYRTHLEHTDLMLTLWCIPVQERPESELGNHLEPRTGTDWIPACVCPGRGGGEKVITSMPNGKTVWQREWMGHLITCDVNHVVLISWDTHCHKFWSKVTRPADLARIWELVLEISSHDAFLGAEQVCVLV